MYEYHGWITLGVSPREVESEQEKLWEVSDRVGRLLKDFQHEYCIASLKVINGRHLAWIAGHTNHGSLESKTLLNLFKSVGELAPGSYGILYIRDDEDKEGFANEFQVWRLARGKFDRFKDHYLSPSIPVIEDA